MVPLIAPSLLRPSRGRGTSAATTSAAPSISKAKHHETRMVPLLPPSLLKHHETRRVPLIPPSQLKHWQEQHPTTKHMSVNHGVAQR